MDSLNYDTHAESGMTPGMLTQKICSRELLSPMTVIRRLLEHIDFFHI